MPTIQRTREKIRQFAQLPEGWHFGEGVPPSEAARSVARILLLRAEGVDFGEVDAFPGVNGEIQVVIYVGANDDYEFTIERNGTITFAHDRAGQEQSSQAGLSLAEAVEAIEHLSNQAWRSSDLFTTITLTQAEVDLGAWLSRTPVMGRASLLLTQNALNAPAGQFANISPDITQQWLASPSFTGEYLTISSLPNALLSSGIVSQVTHATTISDIGKTRLLDDSLKRCA